MSYLEEFQTQWRKLCTLIESDMLESYDRNGELDLNHTEVILDNEKRRWKMSSEYNAAWLEKARRVDGEVAGEFEKALEGVKLVQDTSSRQDAVSPSAVVVGGPAVGGAVAGFAVTKLLNWGTLAVAGTTAAVGLLAGYAGRTYYKDKKKEANRSEVQSYVRRLEEYGRELEAVVRKLDK